MAAEPGSAPGRADAIDGVRMVWKENVGTFSTSRSRLLQGRLSGPETNIHKMKYGLMYICNLPVM